MNKKVIVLVFALFLLISVSCTKYSRVQARESIASTALKYKGVPYKYGGTTPKGFDCSGFVQYVYKKSGIVLPRTVSQMEKVLRKTKSPLKGDIVIFHKPLHTGIYLGNGKFIHASSSRGVVIDKLSEQWFKKRLKGIFTYF